MIIVVIVQMLKTKSELRELKMKKIEIEVEREREITSLEGDMTEKASEKNETEFFLHSLSTILLILFFVSI